MSKNFLQLAGTLVIILMFLDGCGTQILVDTPTPLPPMVETPVVPEQTAQVIPSATVESPPSFTSVLTNTSLPSDTPSQTAAPSSTPESLVLFEDDFSDNHNGWNLKGPVRLSQGKLMISVTNQILVIPIPNLKIHNIKFLVQAEMTLEGDGNCNQSLGYAFGEQDIKYHSFVFINTCDGMGFLHAFDAFYSDGQELFRTEIKQSKPDLRRSHTVRLEYQNDTATLSYDGISTDSQSINPTGEYLSLFMKNEQTETNVYSFDNLRVEKIP